MQAKEFMPIEGDQLLAVLRKARRDLKDLIGTANPEEQEANQQLLEEVIDWSVDDIPVANWPPQATNRFLSMSSALASEAVENAESASPRDETRLQTFQQRADLLCSVAVAAGEQVEAQARLQACHCWVVSRLAEGIGEEESPAFITWAVSTLEPVRVAQEELVALIQTEVAKRSTKRWPPVQSLPTDSPTQTEVVSIRSIEPSVSTLGVDTLLPAQPPVPIENDTLLASPLADETPRSGESPRAHLELPLLNPEQLLHTLRLRYSDFDQLVSTYRQESREANKELLGGILDLISRGVPVIDWPPELGNRFLQTACIVARAAGREAGREAQAAGSLDANTVQTLQERADWLCSFAAATSANMPLPAKPQVCGLWVMSRLLAGTPGGDPTDFAAAAVSALASVGVPQEELVDQVRAQIVLSISQPANAEQWDGSAVETARQWCQELLCQPQYRFLSGAARTLGVDVPPLADETPRSGERPQAKETSTPRPARPVRRPWIRPFRTEQDVGEHFLPTIDELLQLVEAPALRREVQSLDFAKKQYGKWVENPGEQNTNRFLAPAVQAAAAVAEEFQQARRYQEAFRVSNTFAELCKVLIARNRDKYLETFERLLLTGCCAVSGLSLAETEGQPGSDQTGEIESLQQRLEDLCQNALGTYFATRSSEFRRTQAMEPTLGERVINEALARHFDARLRHLLDADRPRVREYVTTNMPLVYRIKLPEPWAKRREDWERLLQEKGYEDVIRTLRDTGDLVSIDQVGQLSPERQDEIRRAQANNDFQRVSELLADSAKELKDHLYREAQARLDYREPPWPSLEDKLRRPFGICRDLAKTKDPDKLRQALGLAKDVWEQDTANYGLRDWVAYLQGRTLNLPAAEDLLLQIRKRRDPKDNFTTDWNLAVLLNDRKDERGERGAFQLLIPLLDREGANEDLILVVLALALRVGDREQFLKTIPRVPGPRFLPLAFAVACEMKDDTRQKGFLGELLQQRQTQWELPPVTERFSTQEDFEKPVSRAIVEGQIDSVVAWLNARIRVARSYIPNYLLLARVLEEECQDVPEAFNVLCQRYNVVRTQQAPEKRRVDEACRDLLELATRSRQKEFGQRAYNMAKEAEASALLLESFEHLAPEREGADEEVTLQREESPHQQQLPPVAEDPKSAEQLPWAMARFASIRNVATYVKEFQAIEEFAKIVAGMFPQESNAVVELIKNISSFIENFSKTGADDRDSRRVLYERTTGSEKRLRQLLEGRALSQRLAEVMTPYCRILEQVVGDLSRQAGVDPTVQVVVENTFLSLEADRSTLVFRVSNPSDRPVTDVLMEALLESPQLAVVGKGERRIAKLAPQQSALLSLPLQRDRAASLSGVSEIACSVSLRAAAEGIPNLDLGITKYRVPVRKFREVIGREGIPKLFQVGQPLRPSEPELFQGRGDILSKIQGSFFEGIQRERYFLDGIRRAGKTSILNFLPAHLPENVLPVRVNLEKFGLQGAINSARVLQQLCLLIQESALTAGVSLDIPDQSLFEVAPGQTFDRFLGEFGAVLPDRTPFLMVDEFQELLQAIARTGAGRDRDTLVLDQLRVHFDERKINAIFSGEIRFDRLSSIVDHRIFSSLTRQRVSFLAEESVSSVLHAGIGPWAPPLPETVKRVYERTGGYPWLVQTYGAGLVDLLNQEHRTVATPEDVDYVTNEAVLCNDELFTFWWPTDQLGPHEERFIDRLFRHYKADQVVLTQEFFNAIHNRERPEFQEALLNLRACEVLDSTQTEQLKFRGSVLRQWLERQIHDGQLRVRKDTPTQTVDRGHAGIFIDHENLIKTLERVSQQRGVPIPSDRSEWFNNILSHLLAEAERRVGRLQYRVTVGFWSRPQEAALLASYFHHGFAPAQPEPIKMDNAADFKLMDELRQAREQSMREISYLGRIIFVTGDGDMSQTARALVNEYAGVQIWGGSRRTHTEYDALVGPENVVVLDDICGL